ncbi:MAG: hypothetical protein QOE77_2003 [Blastocatellia bacterium]|jgi:hypothetical protein|nr:hypothetical protein [Blastocatellia bacterium]
MTTNARAIAAALNREIIDDQPDRLSIHTHSIRLTQANLPYKLVPGKRLPSEKHFAVYADQIVLAEALQNPGRNIELHAREIIVEKPATLDVSGAYADKDFRAGDPPTQKDAKPGAAGTDGDAATAGGNAGSIVIDAHHLVNKTSGPRAKNIADLNAVGAQVLAEHPLKLDDAASLPTMEIARAKIYENYEIVVNLENGRVEGLSHVAFESARIDGTSNRIALRLSISGLKVTGTTNVGGNQRIATQAFVCKLDASATFKTDGSVSELRSEVSFVSDTPIKLPLQYGDGTLGASALNTIRERIIAHIGSGAIETLVKAFGSRLGGSALLLLAGGGRGGRGQDGHAGNVGEKGPDGATTSKNGVETEGGYSFPDEAKGKDGAQGGRAGSPGLSAGGGKGGLIALNVMQPIELSLVYGITGGEGGVQASPGERGPGGPGGTGAVCHMYNYKTGRPIEDMQAPDGKGGPLGNVATSTGSKGSPGANGDSLKFNGAPYTGGTVPAYTFTGLAQTLSLSQLLITQNATDQDFLNAKKEEEVVAVADGYTWLININQPFTDSTITIDTARVSKPDQQVRARIYNSAVVSLMRLQQGLDYYGHSYNWTPVLNLTNLVARTTEIIQLGKVVEDQFNRYLDQGLSNKERMKAFDQAKQEIDRKLAEFVAEIDKLKPQITNFETEVGKLSEALRRQRTLLVEGQLKFKDELIKHLREQNGLTFDGFLDMLATVIGCVGGVVEGIGGIKTAIDAIKKAEEFSKQIKSVVEIFKKAKATIENISKAYSSVKDAFDDGNPNAAKILVDGEEFDKMLKKYLGKFDAAGELRKAMAYFQELAQARNMAAYNYTTLVAQMLTIQAQHDQLYQGIQHINAEIAAHQDNVLPIYTAYLKDAYEDVQRNLLRNIYQENRAYQYWSLKNRQLKTDDLNIATLTATHVGLIKEIDTFRENSQMFNPFEQEVIISADRFPNEFADLHKSKALTFKLDILREEGFLNMRYIIAREFTLEFPDVVDNSHVLYVNVVHTGEAVLNSDTDVDKPGAVHVFSHRPRVSLYKYDYKKKAKTAGGDLGEDSQGYIGVSPFTMWRFDFNLKGNEWLDLSSLKTVVLTFSGRFLGPDARL